MTVLPKIFLIKGDTIFYSYDLTTQLVYAAAKNCDASIFAY